MDILDLYLIMRADGARALLTALMVLSAVATGIGIVLLVSSKAEMDAWGESRKGDLVWYATARRLLKISVPVLCFAAAGVLLVPTTKSLLLIFSADHVLKLEQVEEIAPKSVEALNKLLDEYLEAE